MPLEPESTNELVGVLEHFKAAKEKGEMDDMIVAQLSVQN
jgi:hypothetical protein